MGKEIIPELKGEGFPSHLFSKKTTVISLFSAAFLGENDVQFIAEAGVVNCLLVDIDGQNLIQLFESYGYGICRSDVYQFINSTSLKVNIIVSDQWTGQDKKINDEYFVRLMEIASDYLVLGISQSYINIIGFVPHGEYYKRSDYRGGVYWRVVNVRS